MLLLAAAAVQESSVFEVVTSVFAKMDALAHPEHLARHLAALPVVWGVIFMVSGLVCAFEGYKHYKVVTIAMAFAMGAFAGYCLGKRIDAAYVVSGSMAALFAVMCFPLMKYAVAVIGGLVGSFLGANTWTALATLLSKTPDHVPQYHWIGALIGLIVCGMLAFILFKHSIVLFTSFSGSTMAVLGAVALLLQMPPVRDSLAREMTRAHVVIVPLLVLVPTIIGVILQHGQGEGKGAAAKPPAGKPATA